MDADTRVHIAEVGLVHIVGADFSWRHADKAVEALCQKCPVLPNAAHSLLLLHNPAAFKFVPAERCAPTRCEMSHGCQAFVRVRVSLGGPVGGRAGGARVWEQCPRIEASGAAAF